MDYIKLVRDVVEPLVSNQSSLNVEYVKNEKDPSIIQILVTADNEDIARLIGKGGSVAEAIREIVNVAGKLTSKRVHVRFESQQTK